MSIHFKLIHTPLTNKSFEYFLRLEMGTQAVGYPRKLKILKGSVEAILRWKRILP